MYTRNVGRTNAPRVLMMPPASVPHPVARGGWADWEAPEGPGPRLACMCRCAWGHVVSGTEMLAERDV